MNVTKPVTYLRQVVPLLQDEIQRRADSWENSITGLGTTLRDKRKGLAFTRSPVLSANVLDAMYSDDDLIATIVDTFPDEALAKGFLINIAPEDEKDRDSVESAQALSDEMVTRLEDQFETTEKMNEAWRWGRLFGGGILYAIVDDGADEHEELREDRIKTIISAEVLDRSELQPRSFYEDPDHPKFGQTETYLITASATNASRGDQLRGVTIHETRLIIFPGARTTRRTRAENNGWDSSIIQRLQETVEDFSQAFGSVAHLMTDANQAVFKIKGLMEMISGGDKSALQTRMQLVDMCRSVVRAVLLDADNEEFTRDSPTLTGVPETLQMFMMRLSAATGLPVTRLMGRSPAGENATGEGDERNFLGRVEVQQRHILAPRLKRWVRLSFLAKDGPTNGQEPDKWSIAFPPLWQMTPKEWAEVRKIQSETDDKYILQGVIQPEEVRGSRFTAQGFNPNTILDDDLDLDEDKDEDGEPGGEGPDTPPGEPDDGDEDVAKLALNGAQSQFLIDVAVKVQGAEITPESGVASLRAANPTMTADEAAAIAGQPDPDAPSPPTNAPPVPPTPGVPTPPTPPAPEPPEE